MILGELSTTAGVSGQEDAVRDIILRAIQPHVSDITIDAMGNLLARLSGKSTSAPCVMLAAHMDEVGFLVTGYDADGTLHVDSVGGLDPRILPGLRVRVGKNGLPGVILWAPIHKNRGQDVLPISSLRVDIGVSSKGEAEGKAPKGTMVVFDSHYGQIGKMLRGKAFDDRAGCAMLVDILQNGPYESEVLAAFTVQEEVGLRGATVAARALKPDVAFALEATTAHDLPDPHAEPDDLLTTVNPTCRSGEGPVLTVMDRSVIVNPVLLAYLRQTAADAGIPYQLKTNPGGGTDAGSIHKQNDGIPSAVVSLPTRYIHSPVALLHQSDYAHTVRLFQQVLNTITPDAYTLG